MADAFLMLALAEGFGEAPVPSLLTPDVDPEAVLAAPPQPPDVPPRVAHRLRQRDLADQADAVAHRAERLGVRILTPRDHDWPPRLGRLPQPPLVLFVRGDAGALLRSPAVALVGSRTPTPYGIDASKNLGAVLADAGTVLWSGLARGIDAIAHEACLAASVATVAVLAGGLDEIYPPEHDRLAARIVDGGGCLLSELPCGRRARRGHFLRRNRLLSAGPAAVVVTEGSVASGALRTARFAFECGTDVFAVPGPWCSERSRGCHRLLGEGAGIVESAESLLRALDLGAASPGGRALERSAEEQAILARLRSGPRPTDLLRRECALDPVTFLRTLFALQLHGNVERLPGDLWRATNGR